MKRGVRRQESEVRMGPRNEDRKSLLAATFPSNPVSNKVVDSRLHGNDLWGGFRISIFGIRFAILTPDF